MNATAAALSTYPHPPAFALANGCLVRAYRDLNELDALRPAWDSLLQEYPLASTFSTWEWLTCWWRAFGESRKLLVLGVFDHSNALVGLAPFSVSDESLGGVPVRVLRMMGDGTYDSDNLDMPVQSGYEQPFARAILDYLQKNHAQWDLCELNTLPPDSPSVAFLARVAKARGWTLIESFTPSSAIPLPPTWVEYMATLSSEERRNIPRYTRRLQSRHATRIFRADLDTLPQCLEALFELHQGRWQNAGEKGSFASLQRRNFYTELSCALLKRNALELWALELDQKITAVQYAFRHNDRSFQLQEGYDHRRPSDRLGYVLRGEVLKTLIGEGVRVYDFLGGEDSYKARWGAQPGYYRTLRFAPRFSRGGILLQLSTQAESGKRWLRRNLPRSAWSALRDLNSAIRRTSRTAPAA
jgi:CelD/BcsL family acetyltransferase involved in cellulose biosynthesis